MTNSHCIAINPYTSFQQSIDDVTALIGSSQLYKGINSAGGIYGYYETGIKGATSGAQSNLNQIYGVQLLGNLNNVRTPRCSN